MRERLALCGACESATFVQRDSRSVGCCDPQVEARSPLGPGPGDHRLYQFPADTSSALRPVNEHPDQHWSVTSVLWIMGKAGHQPDPLTSFLGNESHAINPGGPIRGPLVPERFGERVFSSKRRAECHGRIPEGVQAQGTPLEPFLWSNPSDAEVHYLQPKGPMTGYRGSFDHLIRPLQQRLRDREAEGLGGLEVDHQLELGGPLDRQLGRPGAFEYLVHVRDGAAKHGRIAGRVGPGGVCEGRTTLLAELGARSILVLAPEALHAGLPADQSRERSDR
jgi:hypothetical protein